ncbi:hypothetical protein [Spirosoma fluminis]
MKDYLTDQFRDAIDVTSVQLQSVSQAFFQAKADQVIRRHQLECPEIHIWPDPTTGNMIVQVRAD